MQELHVTPSDYHYDYGPILSYNCLFNFILGARGVGKTYGAKKLTLKKFIKNGDEFIYLRRYKSEFDHGKNKTFFDAIIKNDEFPNRELTVDGDHYYLDGVRCGSAIPLSTSRGLKSMDFSKVKYIIFDEFIISNNSRTKYLPDEVSVFLDFYETVARDRDVIVLFLSNTVTIVNPYFLYFNLHPQRGKIIAKNDIAVELNLNDRYTEHKQNTRFGKLTKGSEYADYAYLNEFYEDTPDFIGSMPAGCQYSFTAIFNGREFGFWIDHNEGYMYMNNRVDPYAIRYAFTHLDFVEGSTLVRSWIASERLMAVREYFNYGRVRFETHDTKNAFMQIMQKIR